MFEAKKVTVLTNATAVQVGERLFVLKPHHIDVIRFMVRPGHPDRIAAIKFVRAEYDLGLKEAKDVVDHFYEPRFAPLNDDYALRA